MKLSVLFVCLGNICRSPAAEAVFVAEVQKQNLAPYYTVDSAGIGGWHSGELPDARMRAHAVQRGYCLESRARQVCLADFDTFDLIVGMDDSNIADLRRLALTQEQMQKIVRMTDFCTFFPNDHVPDPYYGGADGFELVLDLLQDACKGLLLRLEKKRLQTSSSN
jgi:protein-tyrosine phosphatase